jgi:antitoxin (DNA-binding transcriptional repressor) of toxin-antitoxin stability system
MKTLQSAEAKAHFSSILRDIQAGDEIAIAFGRKKQTIAVIIPYEQWKKSKKRELGTLKGKVKVKFSKDFLMSDEELINSRNILLILMFYYGRSLILSYYLQIF